MEPKEPPKPTSSPISSLLMRKKRYQPDENYQREKDIWKKPDEQYFIDTILRGFGMPPLFLHKKGKRYYIVDGQQRWNAIVKFRDNKLELSEKYSDDIINDPKNKKQNKGKGAYKYKELAPEWQDQFDSYPLPLVYLEDYDDEEIRNLFRRLQCGKPLIAGEILNAYPGKIVLSMRKLAKHDFFTKIITFRGARYRHCYLAATLMYLESEGIKEIKPKKIEDFFEKNRDLTTNSKVYRKVKRVLNYLRRVFQTKRSEFDTPPWIITIYLLTSYLLDNYVMKGQENNFKNFFLKFRREIDDETPSNKDLKTFKTDVSVKTNDRTTIERRHKTILEKFLKVSKLKKLAENRFFTDKQKSIIFRRDKERCQECGKELTFGHPNTHFHHKDEYIRGGQTEIDRGVLVCKKCHLTKIHKVRN